MKKMKISIITAVTSIIIFILIIVGISLIIRAVFKCIKKGSDTKAKKKSELDKMNIKDL